MLIRAKETAYLFSYLNIYLFVLRGTGPMVYIRAIHSPYESGFPSTKSQHSAAFDPREVTEL